MNAGRSADSHIHADKGEVAWLRSYMGIDDEKEIEANANLIAAAPELLKAVIDCLKELDRSRRPSYAWQLRAKEAIAKAEARS